MPDVLPKAFPCLLYNCICVYVLVSNLVISIKNAGSTWTFLIKHLVYFYILELAFNLG